MNEHIAQTPEDINGAQAEQVEAQPQLAYPEQRLDIGGFARMDGEKTVAYFPDPPTIIEIPTESGVIRTTELTDEQKGVADETMGRKHNRIYLSIDTELNAIRKGLQYDLIDIETGKSIRVRDIEEGQKAERQGTAILRDQQNGSGTPHSDLLPQKEL